MLQWMLGASWDNHSATPFARALEAWGTDTSGWTEIFAKNACFEIHADPQCLRVERAGGKGRREGREAEAHGRGGLSPLAARRRGTETWFIANLWGNKPHH